MAAEGVIAEAIKPVTVPQVEAGLVVNCPCANGPDPRAHEAFTLQSYNKPGVRPLRFKESRVVPVAALIHVPEVASL